jgi:predicted transglutaminase-like cysteine proteinase
MIRVAVYTATALLAGLLTLQTTAAAPTGSFGAASRMSFGPPSGVPRGYYELCRRGSSVCRAQSGALRADRGGAVQLTPNLVRQLEEINLSVNREIRPTSDAPNWDYWSVGLGRGDCEDYALTKKQALMTKGWPSSALVIALAQARGQQHALLIVRTTNGDFALDNLRDKIVGWDKTGYRFEKVQSPRDVWTWHGL